MTTPLRSPTSHPPVHHVRTHGALASAMEGMQRYPRLAVDTEFHAERRYHPELMLVQIAAPDGTAWVVDPQDLEIEELVATLADSMVILHSGEQDLKLLGREAGLFPQNVFDVQRAAALIGLDYPARLGDLSTQLLDIPMDKQETLSDWSTRPLSPVQIAYAVADARVLFGLATVLGDRLEKQGRTAWAQAEAAALVDKVNLPPAVNHHWRDWEIAPALSPEAQRALHALFEWRDARGRDKNQPPHFILSDGLALDLARRRPATVQAVMANRRMPNGLVRRYGSEIVVVIEKALKHTRPIGEVPTKAIRRRAETLAAWGLAFSSRCGIAPKMLMPRSLALQIAQHGSSALTDWRAEAMGAELDRFLSGETALGIDATGPILR